MLSQISEFLPFYAFPYVENPKSHPAYKKLFETDWRTDLRRKLSVFIEPPKESKQPLPKLLTLTSGSKEISRINEKHLQVKTEA